MKIKKNTHSMCKKNAFKKHVDLFLEQEKQKKHYVLITDVNPFMYDHFLYRERLHFCRYYFQAFSKEERLKCQTNGSFKVNSKKRLKYQKK